MWYQPRNPVLRPLQVVVNWFQRRHWLSPKRSASPREFHEMLRQALNDPETALLLRRALVGPVLPFVGGAPSTNYIPKFNSGGTAVDTVAPVFEDSSGNIGIGMTGPVYKLDVASAVGNGSQSYIRINDTTADVTGGLYGGVNATLVIGAQRAGFSDGAGGILDVTTNHPLFLKTNDQTRMTILGGGNVGIGTSSPANILSFGGDTARTVWMERHTTTNTAGNSLTVQAGGATSGATDKNGGDLVLKSGVSTGTATSKIQLQTPNPATSSGTSDNAFSTRMEVGEANVSDDGGGNSLHIGSQLYTVPLSSQSESAALYIKIDPTGTSNQQFGIFGNITSAQEDGEGGFIGVQHNGHGDAMYVAVRGTAGVALESASYVDNNASAGSKGIISTVQASSPNQYNVLCNALWERSTVLPAYGMFFADQAPANALLIRKYAVQGGFQPDDAETQIRIMENDLARSRFAVYNSGKTQISSLAATSGTQTPDSPELVLRGAYWNGSASVDLDWKVRNDVTGSNASRLAIKEPGGNDRVAILDSGDVVLLAAGKGIVFKSPDGNTCKKLTIDDSGNPVWTTVSPCP